MNKARVFTYSMFVFLINLVPLSGYSMDLDVRKQVEDNTFLIVPINSYAPIISRDQADDYINLNCQGAPASPRLLMNCNHLENCGDGNCSVPFAPHGTAFLVGDGSQLLTAWHVLFQTHSAALTFLQQSLAKKTLSERSQMFVSSASPSFVLLNQDLEVIYDTRFEETVYQKIGDPLVPLIHQQGHNGDNFFGYHENIPTDWVVTKLSKSLGQGLRMATAPLDEEKKQFTAGFGFDRYNMTFSINEGSKRDLYSLNSQLENLLEFYIRPEPMSYEDLQQLSIPEFLAHMGYSQQSIEEQQSQYSEQVLLDSIQIVLKTQQRHQRDLWIESHWDEVFFSDIKALPGNSGGPLLNESGEVLGLVSTGFNVQRNEDSPIETFGSGALLFLNTESREIIEIVEQ